MILWFTGQPGSGKTTLCKEMKIQLQKLNISEEKIFHIDGDDLRDLINNKDYSEKGRRSNIRTAMNIASFLSRRKCIVLVSLVSPYLDLREELKSNNKVLEFYVNTSQIRGREHFWAEGYEPPKDNYTNINTDKAIKENLNEILDVYRKMATMA